MNYDLVQHFERFYSHRTGILEGVRAVAFRNLDHLAKAMERDGIRRFTTDGSIASVQDAIIREQGLKPTPIRRWILGCGLANAWEVYQCLVLAEVESYHSVRHFFPLESLNALIKCNTPTLDALKTLRNKLLHPTKDVPYERTLARYFREVESRYPMYYLFVKHLQTLLDQHLRDLKDHLLESLGDEIAHLPDNQLHAFLKRQESDLNRALVRADNNVDKNGIKELLRSHNKFVHNMKIDPARQSDPLKKGQRKRIRCLNDLYNMLATTPLPTPDYHATEPVQRPIHETLSSYIPIPPTSVTKGFYMGTQLPPPFNRAQRDHATLVFRSTLLLNESLHDADAILETYFPNMTRSEIQEIDDLSARIPVPKTPEEIATTQRRTSPGMVAIALLADPLRVYRQVISKRPRLSVPELNRVATDDIVAKLSSWRNTVFHVPDQRVANVDGLEQQLLETFPYDYIKDLVSGLWRFFLRGDTLRPPISN